MTNKTEWEGHTPLPWEDCSGPSYSGTYHTVEKGELMVCELYEGEDAVQAANAALIVHCVNNFPALQAERDALREALVAAREHIMSEADARDYDPPVPCELVADMEHALAISEKSE